MSGTLKRILYDDISDDSDQAKLFRYNSEMQPPASQQMNTAVDYEIDVEVIKCFKLKNMYSSDVTTNARAQYNVKLAAFLIVLDEYKKQYKNNLDKQSVLYYKETSESVITLDEDQCHHTLLPIIQRLLKTICYLMNFSDDEVNYVKQKFIFLPYLKYLNKILKLFQYDKCCAKLTKQLQAQLNTLLTQSVDSCKHIHAINRQSQVLTVFLENPLYECNICRDTFNDERHIKPNECCGYKICNLCYANLWKYSTVFPTCPVCKTSFKSSSVSSFKQVYTADTTDNI
uniref:Immediate early protein 0 n=1 Tax=Helicoverpa armigera nucleopolyhedrovirus TaxID=51313 RepID=A0A0E3JAA0_9ABAC|nr:immediate early protein 0 [Helicoverpa armigera nucleopolyhedrovirus]AJP07702.1 immediate early protein 0 [Helicoverpa armigera nucleopolyhedrovirus]